MWFVIKWNQFYVKQCPPKYLKYIMYTMVNCSPEHKVITSHIDQEIQEEIVQGRMKLGVKKKGEREREGWWVLNKILCINR